MGAVFVTSVLASLDQTIVGTSLPKIVSDLRGFEIYTWVFGAYYLGATATVTVVGKLSDLFGRKAVVILAVGLFTAGSLLCGLSHDMLQLVAFRGMQGIGAGGIQTSTLAIIGDLFPPRERGKWQTVNSGAYATASAIGPALGGFVSDTLTWRWIFFLNLPLAIGAMLAMTYALPTLKRHKRPSIDWAGGALTIVGVLALMLALTWGGREFAWLSAPILVLFGIALSVGLVFRRVERRALEPVVPTGLLRGRVVPFCCTGTFCMGLVWFGVILLGPLFLERVLGLSATQSGADLTPAVVLSGASAALAGVLITRFGRVRPPLAAGAALTLASILWLLTLGPGTTQGVVIAALACGGIGIGLVIPGFLVALQNAVPSNQQGVSMGVMSLFRQMGATIGTTLLGVFVSGSAAESSPEVLARGVHAGYVALAAGAVVLLLMACLVRDVPLRGRLTPEVQLAAAG